MASTYDLAGYGRMMADRARMDAYAAALERAVRPGSVVLDLGTGTGIFALLACRLGARKVYAVEPGDAVHLAREAARANGFTDRIDFFQALSTRVELPERADVLVSDLRGSLPLFQRIVPSLVDARERLLAPGAAMIPRADTIRAAVVEAPELHGKIVAPWDEESRGFDMTPIRRAAVNAWSRGAVSEDALLADPADWAILDYRTIESPDARGRLAWEVRRTGTAHGLSLWFQADLGDGIGYGTGPGTETTYGTPFLPFPTPVEVAPGDRVEVDLEARLVSDDYVWRWETRIERPDRDAVSFRQSTFYAEPLSPARLRKRADSHRPTLGEDGRIDQLALARMAEGAALGEIARELRDRFPARFATWEQALTHVGRLSERYSE